MYDTQIRDLNTITWHNLHFILEHYSTEVLSTLESIIQEAEGHNPKPLMMAQQTKQEVIATVRTLKAIHTVLTHHRYITHAKGEQQ